MQYKITPPAVIDTTVALPASKSISNRALIIHALTGGDIMPDNLSDCDDTEVIVRAFKEKPEVVDLQGAGTAMRFMTAYLSTIPGEHILTGTERMKHRRSATGGRTSGNAEQREFTIHLRPAHDRPHAAARTGTEALRRHHLTALY